MSRESPKKDDTAGSNPPVTLRFLSRRYSYDHTSRVTGGHGTGGAGAGVPFSQSYSYNEFGNMTGRTGSYYNYNFSAPTSDTASYTDNRRTGWSYNADGQVVASPASSTDNPRSVSYDAAGRMVTTVDTGSTSTVTYSASYDGDGQLVYESSNTSPGTFEASYIVRSTVLRDMLTRLDQWGNKKITHVPAERLLFATQRTAGGASVLFTHRNPLGITETTKAVYDPLGNYLPFQQHADPRPPVGSYNSASMSGLSSSQANPHSYGVGCTMDGTPTDCNRAMLSVNNGSAYVDRVISRVGNGIVTQIGLTFDQQYVRVGREVQLATSLRFFRNLGPGGQTTSEPNPQKPALGVDFLRDNSRNTSYGPGKEKMIFDAILALYTDDCINAFKAAGLKDPFTLVTGDTGVVIGPATLAMSPGNTGYMGIPERARQEVLGELGSGQARAFTVMGRYTSDGRPRMFLNTSAFENGLGALVSDMAHEFIHAAGVRGSKPPWYKPWRDDLSFDSKYQNIIDTCRNAAQSFINTRR